MIEWPLDNEGTLILRVDLKGGYELIDLTEDDNLGEARAVPMIAAGSKRLAVKRRPNAIGRPAQKLMQNGRRVVGRPIARRIVSRAVPRIITLTTEVAMSSNLVGWVTFGSMLFLDMLFNAQTINDLSPNAQIMVQTLNDTERFRPQKCGTKPQEEKSRGILTRKQLEQAINSVEWQSWRLDCSGNPIMNRLHVLFNRIAMSTFTTGLLPVHSEGVRRLSIPPPSSIAYRPVIAGDFFVSMAETAEKMELLFEAAEYAFSPGGWLFRCRAWARLFGEHAIFHGSK